MKKQILSIVVFMMLSLTSEGQSFWDDVKISAQFAAAHHDKRISSFSPGKELDILSRTPEKWGTFQYGISVNKQILSQRIFSMDLGLGYSLEYQTFYRPVDYCFDNSDDWCGLRTTYSEDYKIHLIQIPVRIGFEVFKGWELEFVALPLLDIHKSIKDVNSRTDLNFYSFEVNPGMSYNRNDFYFAVHYRFWQLKKVDNVIFSKNTGERSWPGAIDQFESYEDYNPFKLWFSVGYRLGSG